MWLQLPQLQLRWDRMSPESLKLRNHNCGPFSKPWFRHMVLVWFSLWSWILITLYGFSHPSNCLSEFDVDWNAYLISLVDNTTKVLNCEAVEVSLQLLILWKITDKCCWWVAIVVVEIPKTLGNLFVKPI